MAGNHTYSHRVSVAHCWTQAQCVFHSLVLYFSLSFSLHISLYHLEHLSASIQTPTHSFIYPCPLQTAWALVSVITEEVQDRSGTGGRSHKLFLNHCCLSHEGINPPKCCILGCVSVWEKDNVAPVWKSSRLQQEVWTHVHLLYFYFKICTSLVSCIDL